MARPLLSRSALARVLQSLLTAELRVARGRRHGAGIPAEVRLPECWPDALPLGLGGLDCDSLDLLSLAAAVNEMFHLHDARIEGDLLSSALFGGWLDAVESAWRAGVSRFTFTTSGSSGRPKRCVHEAGHLAVEVDGLADRWSSRRRVVGFTPAHHIYGFLFTAMLPDRLAVPCREAEGAGLGALVADPLPGDLIVSIPDRWAFLERSVPSWPADVEGVVSTAPCPPEVLAGLAESGVARMTEVYGSSETAGIAWRAAPNALYDLMPQWRFSEPCDADAPSLIHADGATHDVMDRVVRAGPRAFRLAGRRDGVVQVGGVNVSPAAVAELLRRRPGVRWAAVRLMRPDEGRRLKARLWPDVGVLGEVLRQEVEGWAATHLSAAERPTSITVADGLDSEPPAKGFDW